MNDMQTILTRLAELERRVNNMNRFASVHAVEPGKIRVRFGEKRMGPDGVTGDWLSPWIRTSQHAGFVTENVPYEVGQNVLVNSLNDDFTQATVQPYTDSEHEPMGKDADNKKHTYRIRKPREGGKGENGYEKQEDDDEQDNIRRDDHNGHYRRKGKAKHLFGKGNDGGAETILHEVGNASITVVDGKVTIMAGASIMTFEDGKITQTTGDQTWTYANGTVVSGGTIRHDGKSIDAGHIHGGVLRGGATTDPPAN